MAPGLHLVAQVKGENIPDLSCHRDSLNPEYLGCFTRNVILEKYIFRI